MVHRRCAILTGRALVPDKKQDDEQRLDEPERRSVCQPWMLDHVSQPGLCHHRRDATLKTHALKAAWTLVAVCSA
jgi:hypothetical protein